MIQNHSAVVRLASPVRLDRDDEAPDVASMVRLVSADPPLTVDGALAIAAELGAISAPPGAGRTTDLWESLATVAAADLGAARVIEPHLDALAILDQAGLKRWGNDGTWGVFAAEGGDDPLTATELFDGWLLTGTKPWCSLASRLSDALVSAHVGGERRLFAVSLSGPGIRVSTDDWHARGLSEIPSGPVRFDAVMARPVGDPGWYLSRPGFAWGGIGVAACWFGGAVGLARTVFAAACAEGAHPQLAVHLGAIDELLESARRALAGAAVAIDADAVDAPRILAGRVRGTVARAVEEIVVRTGHALGPAPLALDAAHAKRVADLTLYVRQHHAERDQASLGSALVAAGTRPW